MLSLFNLAVGTLVELGAVFWVGAQLWITIVLPLSAEAHKEERAINTEVQQHFECRFLPFILLVLFLANSGVLIGQAFTVGGGQWSTALLESLVTSGRFGMYWLVREGTITLALLLALSLVIRKKRPQLVNRLFPFINLFLGMVLFIAITLSSHAAAVNGNTIVFAVVIDWLHLLAAAFWIGGMLFIASSYLPILRHHSLVDRSRSLITVLPYYYPLALEGVLLMAVTGPLSATMHLNGWNQLLETAYGRTLLAKMLLVVALLMTGAIHIGFLRPRLRKIYQKHVYVTQRLQAHQTIGEERARKLIAQQVKRREEQLTRGTHRLTQMLCWEPLLGVALFLCVGLMSVFANTLSPAATTPNQQQGGTLPHIAATPNQQQVDSKTQPFQAIIRTSDGKFMVTLNISPDRFGTNIFTVSVVDTNTHTPTTDVRLVLYTTSLDMVMGTGTINLRPDGKGHFIANGDLSMVGHWQIKVQIRTAENTISEAIADVFAQF